MIITVPTTIWSILVICTTSEEGLPTAHYRLKGAVVIGGITAKWHMELTMQDTVCTGIPPPSPCLSGFKCVQCGQPKDGWYQKAIFVYFIVN